MAGSVNKCIIVGNLGKDPEVRSFQNGGRVCNLTVATSERWKDKASGEAKERTEWHRVAIFNDRLVEVAEKYLKKGAKVYLEGQLETRKYTDQSGQEKYTTEIVLRQFRGELTMLDGRAAGTAPEDEDQSAQSYAMASGSNRPAPQRHAGHDVLDSEIPF